MYNLLNLSLHSMQVYDVQVSFLTRCDVSGAETVHSLTLPVKSLKLTCDGLLRALQHKGLVQDASIRYSPLFHVKKPKFLDQ